MGSDNERDSVDEEIEENDTASNDTLVSNKKTKAFVWKYFGFETDGNGRPLHVDSPKCRLCQATVAAKDSNTSNLYSHLRNKHPNEYLLAQHSSNSKAKSSHQSGQASILDLWSKRQRPLSPSLKEHKALTKSVTCCLAKDMLPLSTVDKPGFRAMLHQFNPRYERDVSTLRKLQFLCLSTRLNLR